MAEAAASPASGPRIDAPAAQGRARLPLLDALRGFAFVEMAIYHFAWDLGFFGYIATDVTADLGWRIFARSIASTFLALVGVSLVLATRDGLRRGRFLRRLAMVAAAAAAITLVTWFLFPDMFVFFGILHAIAVASLLGLVFVRAPIPVVALGALFTFLLPRLFTAALFDSPALVWLGLFTVPPRSVDFVPVFPWFGMVLVGILAARLAPRVAPAALARLAAARPRALRPLAWAGRNSLALYLLHQPLLFGLVYVAAQIAPPPPPDFRTLHTQNCTAQCIASGLAEEQCQTACQCITEGAEAAGLAEPLMRNTLSDAQLASYYGIAGQCRAR